MIRHKLTVCRFVFVLAFCQMVQYLSAQNEPDTISYTVKQLLQLAVQNNKDLQLVSFELQKARQQAAVQKSKYLPKVDAFAYYYWLWGNVPLFIFPENEGNILSGGTSDGFYPVSVGLPNNLLAGVTLSQRLFEFSFLSYGKGKEALKTIETDKIQANKEQLVYDVSACYYEISQLAAKEDFIDFNIGRINRMIEILQIQIKNQMADSLQLLDLELKNAELRMAKSELISGIQRKSDYLKSLVGLPDSIVIAFGPLEYTPGVKLSTDSFDTKGSIHMKLLNQALTINDLSQKQVQSEYLPTLDFKANLLWSSQSKDLGFFSSQAYGNNISTLGLKLDIPIYHGAEKKNKIQELEIDRHMLDLQKQKLKEGFQLQYSNSQKELEFKTARFLHQQEITQLKKRFLEKANRQFEQGILSLKDLLDAQSGLLEAQVKLSEMSFDVKLAELDYLKYSNRILILLE
jgi:outer membrane protein